MWPFNTILIVFLKRDGSYARPAILVNGREIEEPLMVRWFAFMFCAAVTATALCAADGPADGGRPDTALAAWKASGAAVHCFDVSMRVETVFIMKVVTVGTMTIGPRKIEVPRREFRPRGPGEPPNVVVQYTRQALSETGKRRSELLPAIGGRWTEARVYDGEATRQVTNSGAQAGVIGRDPDHMEFTEFQCNYLSLFKDLPYGGAMVPLFRSRHGTRLLGRGAGAGEYAVVESPLEKGNYENFGWRVWLDPRHGMLPAKIDLFQRSMQSLFCRTTIERFHQIEPGVWAPVEATHEFGPEGQVRTRVRLSVDMTRSRWNQRLSEDLFKLDFPPGAAVNDRARNLVYVAGDGKPAHHVDQLLEGAPRGQNSPATASPQPGTSVRARIAALAALHIFLVAVLAVVFFMWRARRRAGSKGA
jgi:hypothetical protein